jgi:hypothetical protein
MKRKKDLQNKNNLFNNLDPIVPIVFVVDSMKVWPLMLELIIEHVIILLDVVSYDVDK